MGDEAPHCCFDAWASANAKRAGSRPTVAPVTGRLADAIEATGLRGRSVVDVGSGVGDLCLTLLARGADVGFGIDLGPGAIRHANELAEARGLADRATFVVGDGSRDPLPESDIVALNRVVCCYPDADALLEHVIPAARHVVAFTAPVDRGPAGAWNRLLVWCSNGWYALRSRTYRGFRTFVHDLDAIERRLAEAGFTSVHAETVRGVWRLEVFHRRSSGS